MKAAYIFASAVASALAAIGAWWLLGGRGKSAAPGADGGAAVLPRVEIEGRSFTPLREVEPPRCRPTSRGTFAWYVTLADADAATPERVAQLAAEAGARAGDFFGGGTFRVEGSAAAMRRILKSPEIAGVNAVEPADKIAPALAEIAGRANANATAPAASAPAANASAPAASANATAPEAPARIPVRIVPERGEDAAAVAAALVENGGEHVATDCEGVRGVVDAARVGDIALMSEVRWIETDFPRRLFNNVAVGPALMNVASAREAPLNLSGRGEVISTADSGIDSGRMDSTMHPDFATNLVAIVKFDTTGYDYYGKVITATHTEDLAGHGTHTAGSIAGSGAASGGLYRGAAPGAKLYVANCGDDGGEGYMIPPTMSEVFEMGRGEYPISIASHSWGGETYYYKSTSRYIDKYCWEHPDFLPVFAVGNEGDPKTVSCEAGAKNVLAVGATQTDRSEWEDYCGQYPNKIAWFSSRGPMSDNRIKPDVVAPGCRIASTRSRQPSATYYFGEIDANYAWECGTSMATPLVAGTLALVREWLVTYRGFTNSPPSAALMKAIVMGGASDLYYLPGHDVTGPAPNSMEGWGRVNLAASIAPADGRKIYLRDRLAYKATNMVEIVTTNTAPIDVQLVWIDYPGTLNASKALVNDLDLEVTDGATLWRGNGGSAADRRNNAESVRIAAATAGVYRISVKPYSVKYTGGGAAALYIRAACAAPDARDVSADPGYANLRIRIEGTYRGAVNPAAGLHRFPTNTVITASAEPYLYASYGAGRAEAERYKASFTGAGDAPASGDSNAVFTLMRDSEITWRWADEPSDFRYREFAFLTETSEEHCLTDCWLPNGEVFNVPLPEGAVTGETWIAEGGRVARFGAFEYMRTDEPENGFIFYDAATGLMPTNVVVTVDEGMDIRYHYHDVNATVPGSTIPRWWYMRNLYYLDDESGAYSTDAGDPDGDGFGNRAEYEGGTVPVDFKSFPLSIAAFAPTNLVFVGGKIGAAAVERAESMRPPKWVKIWESLDERVSVTNSVDLKDYSAATNGFFRVRYTW